MAWKAFCRLEIFTRLGMAHTCCRYSHDYEDILIVSSDERSELQEEDREAGLLDDLNSMMDKYEELEVNHPGPFSEFLAFKWSPLNSILDYNETQEGYRKQSGHPYWPEEYIGCGSEVFFMTLDELKEMAFGKDDESGNGEGKLEDFENLEKWPEPMDDFCSCGSDA